MSEIPETRVRKDNYLSVAAAETPSSHRRSTSSIGSYKTEVDDEPDLVSFDKGTTRRHTKIRLSRLDCLMGIFFPGKAKRKVEKTIVTEAADENEFMNNRGSPWIITVNVLSTDKIGSHFVPKTAQCTVDTGNLQGNTVSKEFLIHTLGFPESAIEPLKDSEKNGGVSTTGDILMPEGACYLTWYHAKSTRVFRGMRFLVSPNPRCDLVIGARSIERHNLLSPPNLMNHQVVGIVDPSGTFMDYSYSETYGGTSCLTTNLDHKEVKLNAIQAKYSSNVINLTTQLEDAEEDEPEEVEELRTRLSDMEKLHKVSKLDIEYYLAKVTVTKNNSPENQILAKTAKDKLEEAKKALPEGDAKENLLKDLKNAVTTGFSVGSGSTSQRHGTKA